MAKRLPLVFEGGEIIESKATDTTDLGNGVITAAGGDTERNLKDILGDAINVKDYGAKGDGTTDDTEAFQKAALAAAAKGGVIYVPHGTYKVTETINGEFISYGHPQFVGSAASAMTNKLTDLYDDYVHKTKNVNETITGTKTFSSSPLVPTPAATDNSQKAMNTAWLRNAVSGNTTGLSFDSNGKLKVDPSGMSPEAIKALIKSLLPGNGTDSSDGFEVDDTTGKLKVKPSELISGTGSDGLGIDGNGKIKVVPSELAGTGLAADDSTGKLSTKLKSNGGLGVDSNGLYINLNAIAGDGLIAADDQLNVDIAAIAAALSSGEDDVNAALMLAALGLPVNIATDTSVTWYVNYDSSNASDEPTWGQLVSSSALMTSSDIPKNPTTGNQYSTSAKASKAYMAAYRWGTNANYPFKTIGGALKFIRTQYTLSNKDSYVTVTPRSNNDAYAGFSSGAYTTGGGKLRLQSSNSSKVLVQKNLESGSVVLLSSSDYQINDFHFKAIWYGNSTTDISSDITSIVHVTGNNNVNLVDCIFTLDDHTKKDANNNNTHYVYIDDSLTGTALTAENNKDYDGISTTRLIRSRNGASIWLYGGTFNLTHSSSNSIPAASGAWRGALFFAEISAYIGFVKKNRTYTFTGSANTLFTATRQSMLGGYGTGTETITTTSFTVYKLFNCQNASGYEANSFGNNSTWHNIAVPSGLVRPSDTFSSGSWHEGYTPYIKNGDNPVSLQQRVAALEIA